MFVKYFDKLSRGKLVFFKFWFFNGFVCVDMVLDICLYLVWVLILIIEGLE